MSLDKRSLNLGRLAALFRLVLGDGRGDRGAALLAEFRAVGLDPFVGCVAVDVELLEMRHHIAPDHCVAFLRRRPVRPIVREQEKGTKTAALLLQKLDALDRIVRGADNRGVGREIGLDRIAYPFGHQRQIGDVPEIGQPFGQSEACGKNVPLKAN